jgi:hypothetical protein
LTRCGFEFAGWVPGLVKGMMSFRQTRFLRFRLWLGRSPRILGACIFLTTTLIMLSLGWWMRWAHEHHRWDHIAVFLGAIAIYAWKYWDYRD